MDLSNGLRGVADKGLNEVDTVYGGGDAVQWERTTVNSTSPQRLRAGTYQNRSGFGRQRKGQFQRGTGIKWDTGLKVDTRARNIANLSTIGFDRPPGQEDLKWQRYSVSAGSATLSHTGPRVNKCTKLASAA